MSQIRDVVMVDFIRTAFGRAAKKKPGFFANIRSDDLGIIVLDALMKRTQVKPEMVDELIIGTPGQTGEQANVARNIAIASDWPFEGTALNVDRACGSSLSGAQVGIMEIQTGVADIVVAGGIESNSHLGMPFFDSNSDPAEFRKQWEMRSNMNVKVENRLGGQMNLGMGFTAERQADMYNISREELDQWAYRSNITAATAQKAGKFKCEILPIEVKQADGTTIIADFDQDVKPDSNIEKIRTLPPVYKPGGKINAANSSKESDGAALAMFMTKEKAKKLGLKPMLTIRSWAVAGCDPLVMGVSAYLASKKALERAGLSAKDMDLWEVNEAFAVVTVHVIKEFGIDPEKVNVNGGACCIGHATGASGIRMLGTLAHEMNRRGSRYGMASICGGMGQGSAVVAEREKYWDGRASFLEPLATVKT